jgi:peptidylprolyl isomerase
VTKRLLLALAFLVVPTSLASAAFRIIPGRMTLTDTGLRYQEVRVGRGAMPEAGQTVSVLYTGWLWNGKRVTRQFDSSMNRRNPFRFQLGEQEVIAGWDEGIATMRVGGTRLLLIPPDLAYGDEGAGGVIPAGATLVFEVQLLAVH